jgi:hypothetical protein
VSPHAERHAAATGTPTLTRDSDGMLVGWGWALDAVVEQLRDEWLEGWRSL